MKRAHWLALLLCLLSTHGFASDNFSLIFGRWEVNAIYSPHATSIDRSELGAVVKITENSVSDSLSGGDAPGKIGFREVPSVQKQKLIKKLDPSWLKHGDKKVRLISITSDGIDFILLMKLPDGSLAQFSDGSVVYKLIRKDSR